MIFKAKAGSKAYEYIKNIYEAEEKEYEAYLNRIKEAIGFNFEDISGYTPETDYCRKFEVHSLVVSEDTWEQLDKKLWRKIGCRNGNLLIAPDKRTKQGKAISSLFLSYKEITTHWDILQALGFATNSRRNPCLFYKNGYCFVRLEYLDGDDKNSNFEMISELEYELLINEEKDV